MADGKKTPFFQKQRRRITLDDWQPKLNQQNEKRIKLDIILPLTGQKIVGIPAFISEAYKNMEAEDNAVKDTDFSTELEGVTVEFFATDTSPRTLMITGATLRDFKLVRIRKDNATIVALKFNTTVKRNMTELKFAHENHGTDLFAEFSEAQMSIPAPGSADSQMELGEDADDDGPGPAEKLRNFRDTEANKKAAGKK